MTRVGVAGLSHLGIVTAAAWAAKGLEVVGFDPDAGRVAGLRKGCLPIQEPGLAELMAGPRLTSDLAELGGCDLVLVARDAPTDEANRVDVSVVEGLLDIVVPALPEGAVVALMSQVPPGFTRRAAERTGLGERLYYLVETLVVGDAVRRALEPERFIVGCAEAPATIAPALRARLERFGCPILPVRRESAELAKTAINVYLIGSVTYANEMADLCEDVGADWAEIAPALRLDRRIGPYAYLRPGLGIAGGNLERDLATLLGLAATSSRPAGYLQALADANARRFEWITRRLDEEVFAEVARPRIALWGLAYKRDTDTIKNSPGVRLARALAGRADVVAWDPAVPAVAGLAAEIAPGRDEALAGADGLVVATDWPAFARVDARGMRRAVVIDCVGIVEEARGARLVRMGARP